MRNFIKSLSPLERFMALQLVAATLAFGLPLALSFLAVLILDPVFGFAGAVVAILALLRVGGRPDLVPRRVVGASLLVWTVCAVAWWGLAIALGQAIGSALVPWNTHNFVAFRCAELPLFTTACLAYFQLGPFRPAASPRARNQGWRQAIEARSCLRPAGPARPELVEQAERMLLVRLPRSYREFLLDHGETHGRLRLLGLSPTTDLGHPTAEDFVGATRDARSRLGLPGHLLVCAVEADGRLACIDTQLTKDDEGPVVIWDPTTRTAQDRAGDSFSEYVITHLR